jgi:hypothetical protein
MALQSFAVLARECGKPPEIKLDRMAHELATSEGTRPYLDCLIKAYRDNAAGLEAALQGVRDLPLEKRYTWRVFSAVK